MILSLALRYQKHIALFLLSISFVQLTIAERIGRRYDPYTWGRINTHNRYVPSLGNIWAPEERSVTKELNAPVIKFDKQAANRPFVGGPTQPESQSFTSVNSNNMVDLFSGDFSYNIPLLDVGGYPVNIAYHSGITMDEEASWVGLGWNINPGTVTRNMRGVPDDFNGGADTIKKITSVKPNKSFGVTLGADMELFGLSNVKGSKGQDSSASVPKGSIGASYGIFHNTYKGWGFERGLNASLNVGSKSFGSLSGGLSLTNNSQEGVSIAPSLSASLKREYDGGEKGWDVGVSIAAPYNSRAGLRGMQLGLNANHWAKQKGKPNDGKHVDRGGGGFGSYSFAWPTTVPAVTMPMTNFNQSFTLKVGGEIKGVHYNGYISGYFGKEYIAPEDMTVSMPVFGYLNYQNMVGNRDALSDFNREKELFYREKPAVPHIGVPAYTYDVFAISGEGTGGTFRPYRSDIGFIADHRMRSKTSSDAVSLDIGLGDAVHGGIDLNRNYSYTQNGPWEAENTIGNTINFRKNDKLFEAVYFRNPAEKAINTTAFYDAIGGDDVVTVGLNQLRSNGPTTIASNTLNRYSEKKKVGSVDLTRDNAIKTTRDKRAQVISYHTAAEASVSGLDKYIYHHEINKFGPRHCDDISVGDTLGFGTGWDGYFYKNTEFRGDAYLGVQDSQSVYYDWERWTPFWCEKGNIWTHQDRNFNNDNFTVRWLGRLKAPLTGAYTLGILVNDRCRVWMNDTLLFDNWTPKKGKDWMTDTVNLVKDKFYNIRIDYLELGGNGFAYVKMGWKRPDEPANRKFDRDNIIQIDKKYMYAPSVMDTATVDEIITKENRINNFRKSSHISEIDVLNTDGRRYVYGIPVYNILQKEVSFSVDKRDQSISEQTGMTTFTDNENRTGNTAGQNGLYTRQEIPAYAHSFLLTGILSPDYVDMTGNGISDDDLGDAVKFNYSKTAGIAAPFEWRAPYSDSANYSEGLKTDKRDDKAHFISGKKEMWYLHSIESKTMIATFTLEDRDDLLEISEVGGNKMKRGKARRLKQIDLYSKADFLKGGTPRPIKTVHFEYSYDLCPGVNSPYNSLGKLTLKKIWFTYNDNKKGQLNPYEFFYHSNNPRYQNNAVDKWGTYKHPAQNPGAGLEPVTNADYPYALQDSTLAANNASAWTMDSIKLPSGGRIKVKYESDDYAYVQNRRATQMMELAGFGSNSSSGIDNDRLYSLADLALGNTDYKYVFVKVPVAVTNKAELYARYLDGLKKLYFRLYVQMPLDKWGSGSEYVPVYATPDTTLKNWYGTTNDPNIIWIKIDGVNGDGDGSGNLSPLAQAAINYLRLNLPSKAYPDSEPGEEFDPAVAVKTLVPNLGELANMVLGFNKMARLKNQAAHTKLFRSYVRLNCPSLKKLGGGLRVKTVLIYDHWNKMTNQREAVYGQTYDYTTTQSVNGKETRISSGVAAWEPVMGAEENPFHLPIEYQNQISVMAPAASQYSEEPLGEAFFPGASVGYSKIRVRSIHTDKTRSANGFSETRYFTTYDFPTIWDWSMIDNDNKKRYKPVLRNFLRIDSKSYLSLSQGFKVELNDMNGKVRSEASYSETNSVTPVTSTEYFYKVDNKSQTHKHLNNIVTTIDPLGNINTNATIGKDVELMADMRDQTSVSQGANINVNTDFFTVGGFPAIIPALLNLFQKETNRFRSAAMTKVIYRYGIVDSVVSIDKGSRVSAINLLYDAETGDPLLTSSQNEFNDRVYQFTYPAHWVYKGIAPAYQNIGAILEHLRIKNGKILDGTNGQDSLYLTAGDELLVYSKQTTLASECGTDSFATFPDMYKLWVIDSNSVRGGEQKLYLVGKDGTPFSGNDVTVKVIRSGHRNINGAVGSIVSLGNPMVLGSDGKYNLRFDATTKVINAGASEMAQFWKVADKRRTDLTKDCIPTSADSARFANEACSCMKPFFDYLLASQKMFPKNFRERNRTVGQLVSEANSAGYTININDCALLKDNLNKLFKPITQSPDIKQYACMIGDAQVILWRPPTATGSIYELAPGICTPNGVFYRKTGVVIPKPDTVTVRITPDFTASLLSTQNCPTFRDSLTQVDSITDRLLVETNLDLGGYKRNAISVLRFNGVSSIPEYNADIISAKLILTADQRGHYGTMYPNANSVNPVDTLSASLASPGWFKGVPLETYHNLAVNSPWHKEVRRVVPFQNDTIDVKDYIEGYRNRTYGTRTFMLTQGSKDFHLVNDSMYGVFVEPPPYLQSGYDNYYSTYYSQRYADASKWPVIEVTYVVTPPMPDTVGARLTYNGTLQCSDMNSPSCYSAVTDTMVNPYQYGILGNFRPLRSYVYYGRRVDSIADPNQQINTRTMGVISEFAPFWILNDKRWVPSYDTTRWVWNAQTTLFNRKGFELENKDPLGRYNAGIYGYGLTMPTAVLQNSHFQEGAFEGFEDYDFETNTCDNACPVARSFDWSAHKADFTTSQSHTGIYSLKVDEDSLTSISADLLPAADSDIAQFTSVTSTACGGQLKGMKASKNIVLPNFAPIPGKKVIVGGWVKEDNSCLCKGYTNNHIIISFIVGGSVVTKQLSPAGNLVEGWQRYEEVVDIPVNATKMTITLQASDSAATYFDDIRIHPYNAQMKSFVYSATNLRLMAELDENNYATFYEYDDDGTLVRLKKETERGVQTIKESRSALLKE